jgi:hypothetical protein
MSAISANRNKPPTQTANNGRPEKAFDLKPGPAVDPRRRGSTATTAEYLSGLRSTEKNVREFGKTITSLSEFLNATGKPVAQSPHGSFVDARDSIIYIKDKNQPHLTVSFDPKDSKTCCWDTSSGEPKQLKGKDAESAIRIMKNAAVSAAVNPNSWTAAK